jgi:hypothetical protein
VTCSYDGPTYDGYACDLSGQFWVSVTGCYATYVVVDWGDGAITQQEGLEPDVRLDHTYSSPGVYYTNLQANFDPYDCGTESIDLTYVFEYPSQGGSN